MNYDDLRKQVERQLNAGRSNNFFQGSNIHNDLLNRAKVSSWSSWGSNYGNNHNDLINKAKESANNWNSGSNWGKLDSDTKNLANSARNAIENNLDENDVARTLANTASEEARNDGIATQVIYQTLKIILIMNNDLQYCFMILQI